ncbi:MAG TPA: serine hydrolase [Terracidiphilus sp.]|nr:serine hydrolase [Terracidiphilus sp.]
MAMSKGGLRSLLGAAFVLAAVCATPGSRSIAQGAAPSVQARIDRVVTCLRQPFYVKGDPCVGLAERMAALHVSGVSVAVIHNGQLEWARGFGVEQVGGKPVTPETRFQAGSISKPVAAMAALHLVEEGKLGLDQDANTELSSWKMSVGPEGAGKAVTLRELLMHTAGTTVHGFPGYAHGEPVPTLVQVLNGEAPANTPAVKVATVPGSSWNYSGGGFTIMQMMAIEAAKEPFPKLMHDAVLAPIGMKHSTYDQPLPSADRPVATPYNEDGTPVAGGAHTYPEMAAAGLWTTASDLAQYIIENQHSLAGHANHVLSQAMTKQMLTPGIGNWGLGVQIGGSKKDPFFTHDGINAGFESVFVGYENHGDGAVVMTNAQGGERLAKELIQSIATEYDWPNFSGKMMVELDPSILEKYAGTYDLAPSSSLTFTVEGNQLFGAMNQQGKTPIFAESETRFFLKMADVQIDFVKDGQGQVTGLVVHQNGEDQKGVRRK